jgi:hypothetical protein
LDGLVYNDISPLLLNLYYKWADSEQYRPALADYISGYNVDQTANPWAVHPEHCLTKLDNIALTLLSSNLRDKNYVAEKVHKIRIRTNSQKAKIFIPSWWNDVITLVECDTKPLSGCTNLNKVIDFYITRFAKVDRAMRNLYAAFLQDEKIIRPLQEYYENLNHELLQQWFSFTVDYKPDQQGFLANVLKTAKSPVAIIVGDGIRYEIADYIATSLEKQFRVDKQIMLADLPSETENNMSALFVGNSEVLSDQSEREKRLFLSTGKNIVYKNLEGLHYGIKADYLILKYGDIDYTGEKLQHGAIKLFEEFERVLKDKIALLLNMGFAEVHLVTDHGFVLTGLLEESDKIDQQITGKKKVSERYILTTEKQTSDDLIGFERPYGEYKYVYFSKNHRPFKSTGAYGYSHGGFTPQEVIIPKFVFRKDKPATSGLVVKITNKSDLTDVLGEFFAIKIQGTSKASDLFASNRKVQVLLYAGGKTYTTSSIINLDSGQTASLEFSFSGNTEVQAVVIDVSTQEQLDSVVMKKSITRDLGGLM